MADIVERLREACRTPTGYEMPDHSEPWGVDCGFLREVATELEALRKRCEAVEADAARWQHARWHAMSELLGAYPTTDTSDIGLDYAVDQAIAAAQEPSHG